MDGPSLSVKQHFYETYLKPLLTESPNSNVYSYLLDQAYHGWTIQISKEDLDRVKLYVDLAQGLYKSDIDNFVSFCSQMLGASYDVYVKSRTIHTGNSNDDIEKKYRDLLDEYKILFENNFSLWVSVVYYYVCHFYGKKTKAEDPSYYISVGASKKFYTIKDVKLSLEGMDMKVFLDGADTVLRNAGSGHENWEVSDDNKLICHNIDPASGRNKGDLILAKGELIDRLRFLKRTIWCMQVGFTVFLVNNPSIMGEIKGKAQFKNKEIISHLQAFCRNRWLKLKECKFENEEISMIIQHSPEIVGHGGEVYFGDGSGYELIDRDFEVEYKYQILDVLKYLCAGFLDECNLPTISVIIKNDEGEILSTVVYKPSELKKLFVLTSEKLIPNPHTGQLPEGSYKIKYKVKVPFGMRRWGEDFLRRYDNGEFDHLIGKK